MTSSVQSKEVHAAENADSRQHVDIRDQQSLDRWSHALGVTAEALQGAVRTVGPRIDKIKDYLTAGMAADQSDG